MPNYKLRVVRPRVMDPYLCYVTERVTALPELESRFMVVPRVRGQQLKDQAQLDGWLRDGSAAAVERLCAWE